MNELDERYSTAEEAIYDAFFLVLKDKSLDKVTVSDVIKKAAGFRRLPSIKGLWERMSKHSV